MVVIERSESEAHSVELGEILRIWTDILRREVKTSVSGDGEAGGPLIRFCMVSLNVLGLHLDQDAIRASIRRLP